MVGKFDESRSILREGLGGLVWVGGTRVSGGSKVFRSRNLVRKRACLTLVFRVYVVYYRMSGTWYLVRSTTAVVLIVY